MTDATDVLNERKRRRARRIGGAAQLAVTPAAVILYQDAVVEAQQILRQISGGQMRLGELADKLEPRYGERTLQRFAAEIGIAPCTLERHRSVYRAWQIPAPGPELPYSIARELATHPDRAEIIRNNPTITRREARARMCALREVATAAAPSNVVSITPATATESESEYVSETTRLGRMLVFANKVTGWAQDVREFRGELNATITQAFRDAADALGQTADDFERRLRLQEEREPERVH